MKLVGACLYTPRKRKTDLQGKSEENPMESPEKENKEEVVNTEDEILEHEKKTDSEHHSKSDNYFSRKFGSLLNRSKRKYKRQESQDTASQNGEGSDRSPTSPKKHGKGFFRRTKSLKSHDSSEHNEKRSSVATEQTVDNGDLESLQNQEDRSKRRMTHTKYGEQRQVVVQGKALREVEVTGEKPEEGSTRKQRRLSKKKTIDVDDLSVSCRQLGVADFEGWMFKKSGGTGFTPVSWKKWWCVLKSGKLYLYKTSFDQGAHHVYELKNYTLIQVPEEKRKCSFKIQPKNVAKEALADAKAIVFATEVESEVDRWSDVLQKASQGLAVQIEQENEEVLTNDRRRCYTTGTKQMKAKGKQNGAPQPKSRRPHSSSLTGDETTGLPTHSGSVSGRTRKISNSGTSGASVLAVGSMFRPIDNPDDRSRVPINLLPDEEADPELEEKAVTPRAEDGGTGTTATDDKLPDVVESTLESKGKGETDSVGRAPTAEELQRTLDVRKEIERLENQARVPEGSRPKSDVEHGDNHVIIDSPLTGEQVDDDGAMAPLAMAPLAVAEKPEEEKETVALNRDSTTEEIVRNEAESSKEAKEEAVQTAEVAKIEEEPAKSEDAAKIEEGEKEERETSGNDDANPSSISMPDPSHGETLAESEEPKELHEERERPNSSSGDGVENSDDACSETANSKAEVVSSGTAVEETKVLEDSDESEKGHVESASPEVLSQSQEVDPILEKDKKEGDTVELDKRSAELATEVPESCPETVVSSPEVKEDVTKVERESVETEKKLDETGKESDDLKAEMVEAEKSSPQTGEGVVESSEGTVDEPHSQSKEEEDITMTMAIEAEAKSSSGQPRDNQVPSQGIVDGCEKVPCTAQGAQSPSEEGEISTEEIQGSLEESSAEDVQGSPENVHVTPDDVPNAPKNLHGTPDDVQHPPKTVHGTPDDVQGSPEDVHGTTDGSKEPPDDVQSPPKDDEYPVEDTGGSSVSDVPQSDSQGIKVISETDNTGQKEESDAVVKSDEGNNAISLPVEVGSSIAASPDVCEKTVECDVEEGAVLPVNQAADAVHEVKELSPVCDEQSVNKDGDKCDASVEGKVVEDNSTENSAREENNNSLSGNFSQVEQKSDVATAGDSLPVDDASAKENSEAKLEENSGTVIDDTPGEKINT